jgi:RHH-type proline utilization regulon transcriptional repressor/proline dehydrogenase/delta 1-pyrroline-5-carboxylate dehydrogenase
MHDLASFRDQIRAAITADEAEAIPRLSAAAGLGDAAREAIGTEATRLVEKVRQGLSNGLESFLSEYSLSTHEGIALMCLAEALLRVPDAGTIDDLIEDKVASARWLEHFDRDNPLLVNASTLMLTLTGEVLKDAGAGLSGTIRGIVRRLGEPVIRSAVLQAMRILGNQFVLGRTIEEATQVARANEAQGFTHSYDMLGEAARTAADAERYNIAYADAIKVIATRCTAPSVRGNPGVSVKLSALHPRYEFAKRERVMAELVERTLKLALMARDANMGFNIDAEEADRLDLSLDVIAAVLADPRLAGWDGFGIVVQAYGPRTPYVIDWIEALTVRLDRRVMVRLVKGAYWDAEIKRAQVQGLDGFPVFTQKALTDVSYLANARKLLEKRARIYPQFATHNAYTVAAVLHLADELGADKTSFEFQRLHGMGERLHQILRDEFKTTTRIYAPVGRHADLLAYLVRRLLENGANGSFVNMIADRAVPAATVARDPFTLLNPAGNANIRRPLDLFAPSRTNSRGLDITDPVAIAALDADRVAFAGKRWSAGTDSGGEHFVICNPATGAEIGDAYGASPAAVEAAIARAVAAAPAWAAMSPADRATIVRRTADLYEAHAPELYTLAIREAGKTLADAVGEVREAVDFLRYYAAEAERLGQRTSLGVVTCISPWNFPLSIFSGQLTAALLGGNAVLAKPAETTPLIAARAVELFTEAGLPPDVLQLVVGRGATVGAALTADPRIAGICFTGSLPTAKSIDRAMAQNLTPHAPLIAETGGLNAMIVDSTALPEQAVRDILASAFQSAGQRCSALRIVYLQEDSADKIIEMLTGAMDELTLGDPELLSTDIGPVIDTRARDKISAYVDKGDVLKRLATPNAGTFVGPSLLKVGGIADMPEEIFGPVLHVATFAAPDLDQVIDDINDAGYGLTFGLHTRIDARMRHVSSRIHAGNIYINRNQIGAVVGSQPFGGEGLSGTGPKAGGPNYLPRFSRPLLANAPAEPLDMPGPTGESNRLEIHPRGVVLCLGPDDESLQRQVELAEARGNIILQLELSSPEAIDTHFHIDAMMHFGTDIELKPWRQALAARPGAIVPLVTSEADADRLIVERHICIDTTASGGNAELLAGTSGT